MLFLPLYFNLKVPKGNKTALHFPLLYHPAGGWNKAIYICVHSQFTVFQISFQTSKAYTQQIRSSKHILINAPIWLPYIIVNISSPFSFYWLKYSLVLRTGISQSDQYRVCVSLNLLQIWNIKHWRKTPTPDENKGGSSSRTVDYLLLWGQLW